MELTPSVSSAPRRRRGRPRPLLVLGLVAVVLAAGLGALLVFVHPSARASGAFPQDASMEQQLGIRFSRVAVVGDGGLITLSYVVLDSEKASRFQSDVTHPPVLVSESRHLSTHRVSLMKQGHTLRAGQTYYLVYENTRGALRSGEQVTIVDGSMKLTDAPVL